MCLEAEAKVLLTWAEHLQALSALHIAGTDNVVEYFELGSGGPWGMDALPECSLAGGEKMRHADHGSHGDICNRQI